jgi:hypothetical protein
MAADYAWPFDLYEPQAAMETAVTGMTPGAPALRKAAGSLAAVSRQAKFTSNAMG